MQERREEPTLVEPRKSRRVKPQQRRRRLQSTYRWFRISPDIRPDPTMEQWISPYRKKLNARMSEVLVHLKQGFKRQQPESPLGNLVADICLKRLHHMGLQVDVFLTNHGGIRTDLGAGPVTVRNTFEILPFENALVVVRVKGKILLQIMEGLAKRGGEPLAGARVRIARQSRRLLHLEVKGKPVDPNRTYLLGTNDYLAKTGWLRPFLHDRPLYLTGLTLRGVFQWGLRHRVVSFSPQLDGRISLVSNPGPDQPRKKEK